jgi:periplasmic divalent cation tolerance protein
MPDYLIIYITAPSEEEGAEIAKTLVGEKLAACVNIVKDIRSVYFWEGEVQDEKEVLLVVKTRAGLYEKLEARVKEIHPYTVPEIIALPILRGSKEYLGWLKDSTA